MKNPGVLLAGNWTDRKEKMRDGTMKCVNCGSRQVELVSESDTISVRGRGYSLPAVERYRCRSCGEDFFTGEQAQEWSKQAAAIRRREEGLLKPVQIKEIREQLGISQMSLSRLLGVGDKTVARWECGMVIQNKMADDLLRLLRQEPKNVYVLAQQRLGIRVPTYNPRKAAAAIAYLVKRCGQMGMTKLMKMLYFADFEAFRRRRQAITGATYEAWNYGPVPTEIYRDLTESVEGELKLPIRVQIEKKSDTKQKIFRFAPIEDEIDMALLDDEEIAILDEICKKWRGASPEEIVNAVHEDLAWKKAYPNKVIIYPILEKLDERPSIT